MKMSVKRGFQEVPTVTIEELENGKDPHAADHGEISSTTQEELDEAEAGAAEEKNASSS
jgi:hypothetical protein